MKKEVSIDCIGYDVKADLYDGKGGKEVLLFLTGLNSSKKRYEELVKNLTEQTGMSALVLDYSGHGVSPFDIKHVSPAKNFFEVVAVFDWLVENYPKLNISVVVTSYGGYLATHLTVYRAFNKLLLRVLSIHILNEFYTKWEFATSSENRQKYRRDFTDSHDYPLLTNRKKFNGSVFVVTHEFDKSSLKSKYHSLYSSF